MPTSQDTRPVLVAGASGYLGSFLTRELLRRGTPVRALVRHAGSPAAAALAADGANVVAADVTQPGALVGVCDGCRAVASCLAADMHWRGGTPASVDRDANIALFQEAAATAAAAGQHKDRGTAAPAGAGRAGAAGRAAARGGLERFLLVATYEGREAKASVPMQRAKEEAVDHIQQMAGKLQHTGGSPRLLAGEYGLSWTIIRPTAYFKDFTAMPWQRMQKRDWILVPGGGTSRYNPIDGAELARFIADCLLEGTCANEEVRIGGPQVLTFREVVYAAAEAQGKPRQRVRILPLPIVLLRLAAVVASLLGLVWQPAAAVASALRFVVFSTTHDSVGMRYGSRTVADHYRDMMQQQRQAQLQKERGRQEGGLISRLPAKVAELFCQLAPIKYRSKIS